jgi:hypothetical protein
MALTPWGVSFNHAVAAASSNCIQSTTTIAKHFERFDDGTETREQTNKNIGDHLVAFARQFSGDAKPAQALSYVHSAACSPEVQLSGVGEGTGPITAI